MTSVEFNRDVVLAAAARLEAASAKLRGAAGLSEPAMTSALPPGAEEVSAASAARFNARAMQYVNYVQYSAEQLTGAAQALRMAAQNYQVTDSAASQIIKSTVPFAQA